MYTYILCVIIVLGGDSMFWKYPISKWLAPKKDGLYIVKHQGRVYHVGIAFKEKTGKNLKQQVKYHYHNQKTEIDWMYDTKQLTSVQYIVMDDYEAALKLREELYEKYKKRVKRYEV
jgi:hypothetical protein